MKGASHIAPLGVRLPEELKSSLQERARDNGRSMNSEIVQILQDVIDGKLTAVESEQLQLINQLAREQRDIITKLERLTAEADNKKPT
ncbi:Arc family DNA-binding protein [Pantoea sp. BAV 3049]|uniref:Arc family DNA-binding protein n=1 Tax=Pantoea sp. BAV 3049 TaxID=2654188 RepID=UPI00131DFDFA|nr:Arc family DNA-binding protein [Pantoea sp. BAV 3049]